MRIPPLPNGLPAPLQPEDDPQRFPAYVPRPGRKDVCNPDAAWMDAVRQAAARYGDDFDEAWERERQSVAAMYAREDGDSVDALNRRSRGRPLVYPVLPGESPADRKKRLRAERRAASPVVNKQRVTLADLPAVRTAVSNAMQALAAAQAALDAVAALQAAED